MDTNYKWCNRCKTAKRHSEFSKDKSTKDGLKFYCKECDRISHREYYQKNKERINSRSKEWDKNNPEKRKKIEKRYRDNNKDVFRNNQLKRKFGITIEEFILMKEECGNQCMICGVHINELNKDLHVDHDHTSGNIRGLLCSTCNSGLGMFKDSTELLKNAIEYLNRRE